MTTLFFTDECSLQLVQSMIQHPQDTIRASETLPVLKMGLDPKFK